MQARVKEKAQGTSVVMPDETFEDKMVIELGGERILEELEDDPLPRIC